jgi:site-specific DNA recombinase
MTTATTTPSRYEALYARYSSHSQDDSTSIAVQIESCEKAAGKKLVHFIDSAKTGRTIGGRLELLRLIQEAEAGRISKLYIFKFDRLGRAAGTHVLIEDLESCGVEVVSVTEGTNSLARGVQLVVAADYSRVLAERTRLGLIKRHEEGGHIGGPAPYGYKIIPADGGRKKLAINDVEADAIKMMVKIYLTESVGLKEIGRRLENAGVKTRLGGPWNFTTVRGTLTNRMLVGQVLYARRTFKLNKSTGRRVPVQNDAKMRRIRDDQSLRILDDDTFNAIQDKLALAHQALAPRGPKQQRVFTHLLFCSECGSLCYARRSKNAKGEYYYYSCSCRQNKGPQACPNAGSVREDKLKNRIMAAMGQTFIDLEYMIGEALQIAQQQIDVQKAESGRLKAEIAELDKETKKRIPLLTDPAINTMAKEAISDEIGQKRARRNQLQEALDRLGVQAVEDQDMLAGLCRDAFAEAKANFGQLATTTQFNRFVQEVVGPMLVLPGGVVEQKTAPSVSEGRQSLGACSSGGRIRTSDLRVMSVIRSKP